MTISKIYSPSWDETQDKYLIYRVNENDTFQWADVSNDPKLLRRGVDTLKKRYRLISNCHEYLMQLINTSAWPPETNIALEKSAEKNKKNWVNVTAEINKNPLECAMHWCLLKVARLCQPSHNQVVEAPPKRRKINPHSTIANPTRTIQSNQLPPISSLNLPSTAGSQTNSTSNPHSSRANPTRTTQSNQLPPISSLNLPSTAGSQTNPTSNNQRPTVNPPTAVRGQTTPTNVQINVVMIFGVPTGIMGSELEVFEPLNISFGT